jgi:hypothetical protein
VSAADSAELHGANYSYRAYRGVMTSRRRTVPGAEWVRTWLQLVEIAWSAPVVIGYRTARMMAGGWPPSARDRREYTRMVQEKADAFGQAATAAMTTPPRDIARVLGNAVAPVHRRVVANRSRLSRG